MCIIRATTINNYYIIHPPFNLISVIQWFCQKLGSTYSQVETQLFLFPMRMRCSFVPLYAPEAYQYLTLVVFLAPTPTLFLNKTNEITTINTGNCNYFI